MPPCASHVCAGARSAPEYSDRIYTMWPTVVAFPNSRRTKFDYSLTVPCNFDILLPKACLHLSTHHIYLQFSTQKIANPKDKRNYFTSNLIFLAPGVG